MQRDRKWRRRQNHIKWKKLKQAIDSKFFSKHNTIEKNCEWRASRDSFNGHYGPSKTAKAYVYETVRKFRNRCWWDAGWTDCEMKKKCLENAARKEQKEEYLLWLTYGDYNLNISEDEIDDLMI